MGFAWLSSGKVFVSGWVYGATKVGELLVGSVPVLINGFGESADLYGVSDPIFATLGYVNNYTSAKLQIGELGLTGRSWSGLSHCPTSLRHCL